MAKGEHMSNKAHVKICGTIGKDIKIKETQDGYYYGILSVAVNKRVGKKFNSDEPIIKTYWFNIMVWNAEIIERYSKFLKKGEQILVDGDLEVIDRATLEDSDWHDPFKKGHKATNVVITVRNKNAISILAKLPSQNSDNENSHIANDCQSLNSGGLVDSRVFEKL